MVGTKLNQKVWSVGNGFFSCNLPIHNYQQENESDGEYDPVIGEWMEWKEGDFSLVKTEQLPLSCSVVEIFEVFNILLGM